MSFFTLIAAYFVSAHGIETTKWLNGRVYARMELCKSPLLRVTNKAAGTALPTSTGPEGLFRLDLSGTPAGTVLTIEAECPPREHRQSEKALKAEYTLDTGKVDWRGPSELVLFNDVAILGFGYPRTEAL